MTTELDKYKAYAHRLVRDPNDTSALTDQFTLLTKARKANKGFYYRLARRAHELAPQDVQCAFTHASALDETGRSEEALAIYQQIMTFPNVGDLMPHLLHAIGVAYRNTGDNERSIAFYERSTELMSSSLFDRDRAISTMAAATMGTRSFVEALRAFEVRRQYAEERLKEDGTKAVLQKLPSNVTHWQGEDIAGKTIVVYHEEGVGDFLMVSRFIPKLREYNPAKILLTGPVPDLVDFVNAQLGLDGTVPLFEPFESDFVIGSMSLPWRLGIEYKDIDGEPYFGAVPANIPRRGNLNVGLVWRGNPKYSRDHTRSMPFEKFVPLFDMPDVAFYSLQVGPASTEITNLGFDGFVADLQPFMKSWEQSVRIIQALDAVITVDTAVAHLAGALGKPTFIMVNQACDWRWHRESEETAWYKSARVLRQTEYGKWAPVVERVRSKLKELIDGKRGQTGLRDAPWGQSSIAVAG